MAAEGNASFPGMLARWLLAAQWRSHRGRLLVAVLTIALGVGLGYAVNLINDAAFTEFSAAARGLSGLADLQVRSAQPFMDEDIYPRLASHAGVATASPVIDVDVAVPGRNTTLKILGVDVFRLKYITPDLIPVPSSQALLDLLDDDAIFVSPGARAWLGVRDGDRVDLQSGTLPVRLRVAGSISPAQPSQRLAVMDIAAVQERLGLQGKLSRVDLRLAQGVDRDAFRRALQRELGVPLVVSSPQDAQSRMDWLSRSYRINMSVLALMALFTGAFLVFATQVEGVVRRRTYFATLRVLGMTRQTLIRQVMFEGMLLGLAGGVLGVGLGLGIATLVLHLAGGDLGGGYFPGVEPHVHVDARVALIFLALGTGVALMGTLAPALEAARAQPAPAMKAGSDEAALVPLQSPWYALGCLLIAALLTQAPPVHGVPLAGYAAVALLLMGMMALMPRLTATVFRWLGGRRRVMHGSAVRMLALARLANAPGRASIAIGGVVSSFALIVAMAIMVTSFRVSFEHWLSHILFGDVYVRLSSGGDATSLPPGQQAQLAAVNGIARVAFMRESTLMLDAAKPPVALIARDIDASDPGATLQMTGAALRPASWGRDETPVWISEAMVDLYGYRVGERIALPLGRPGKRFVVAGIWRDYARQTGGLRMRLVDYRSLTGDMGVTDAALTLRAGVSSRQVIDALRALPFGRALEFSQAAEIRTRALATFDRAFAVTYLLEAVAIAMGLFGVGATFSMQVLVRGREFGMLRHVGMTRRQVVAIIAAEAGWLTSLGMLVGGVLGFAVSLILVFVVNPQSFHWSMSLHVPWRDIAVIACVMLASSCATAMLFCRGVISTDALRAVREDG